MAMHYSKHPRQRADDFGIPSRKTSGAGQILSSKATRIGQIEHCRRGMQHEAAQRRPAIPVRDINRRNAAPREEKTSTTITPKIGDQDQVLSSTKSGIQLPEWASLPTRRIYLCQCEEGGSSERKHHDLCTSTSFVVGRHHGENMIAVDHFSVSRKHALLVHRADELLVMDTSSNGTWIDGNRYKSDSKTFFFFFSSLWCVSLCARPIIEKRARHVSYRPRPEILPLHKCAPSRQARLGVHVCTKQRWLGGIVCN